jgi:hypothetical protein
MDINEMDQGLLKRHPSMTQAQFSHDWFTKHAPLVVPFFLHSGITHYEQLHGPLLPSPTTPPTLVPLIANYAGAAGLTSPTILSTFPPASFPAWKLAYYREIILVDERRFLESEALEHVYRVPPQTVMGERRVVIEDGKCLIEVSEEVWEVWRGYESRGEGDGEKK